VEHAGEEKTHFLALLMTIDSWEPHSYFAKRNRAQNLKEKEKSGPEVPDVSKGETSLASPAKELFTSHLKSFSR